MVGMNGLFVLDEFKHLWRGGGDRGGKGKEAICLF